MTESHHMTDQQLSARFNDHRNIQVGRARVIYAPAWAYLPEGWCLPGGGRTADYARAYDVALKMDQLMQVPRP